MRHMRKLLALLMVFAVVLALATTAFAADGEGNTISVKDAQANETYNLYKMLDLSVDLDKNAYSYILNGEWAAFFTGTGAGAAYVDIDTVGDIQYVTWKEDKGTAEDMEAFGKLAAAYADDLSALDSKKPDADGTIVFDGLTPGYYLITSTNGTLAIVDTTPDKEDVVIEEKNEDPTVTKQVMEDSTSEYGMANSAQIGDTINYTSTVTVHKGAKNLVVHDSMSASLTLNADSVVVAGLTKGDDYDVITTGLSDGCTFEIVFKQAYLDNVRETTELVVNYNAVLNENAKVAEDATNAIHLTWGDNSESATITTITNTYKFAVLKYVAGDTQKALLANAVFQLQKDGNVVKLIKESETEYRVANGDEANAVETFTTVATGNIVINGVDLDAYQLVEITPPAGYNQLKTPVDVTVDAENELVVEVENNAGTELPSTGGIGTTIFYVIGGILVLGAVVLLVTKKRMRTAE